MNEQWKELLEWAGWTDHKDSGLWLPPEGKDQHYKNPPEPTEGNVSELLYGWPKDKTMVVEIIRGTSGFQVDLYSSDKHGIGIATLLEAAHSAMKGLE